MVRFMLFLFFVAHNAHASSAITYSFNGGRLGDNLTTYIKAKWLSYKYNLPLLYQPFPYSDQLKLHELETRYTYEKSKEYKTHVMRLSIASENAIKIDRNAHALYWVHLYFKLAGWSELDEIRDERFIALLKKLIAPRGSLPLMELPKDKISVAVHVRRGGTFEKPDFSKTTGMIYPPLRFPPDQFYIDQLKKLPAYFPGQHFYVHIFTDDPDPRSIAQKYEAAVDNAFFSFNFRAHNNGHDHNVLDDLFAMARFDCLIRPASGFSRIAQLIGKHTMVIAPTTCSFEGDTLIITEVKVVKRSNYGQTRS